MWQLNPEMTATGWTVSGRRDESQPLVLHRTDRIVWSGLYSLFLEHWLKYHSESKFVMVHVELLWNGNVIDAMAKLQSSLGLPYYNFSDLTTFDPITKRYKLKNCRSVLR